MDVNALNYYRFSLMPLPPNDGIAGSSSKDQPNEALIALPNLVESSEVLQLAPFLWKGFLQFLRPTFGPCHLAVEFTLG